MSYSGSCLCGEVKFKFKFDPMMQSQCHCTTCRKVFGTSHKALAMPEDELYWDGELQRHSIKDDSGSGLHYNYCPKCSVIVYNKPDLLDGMVCLPAGLLADEIKFTPTVELQTSDKADWLQQAKSLKASFKDNATVERLQELFENIDQRQ